MSGPDRTVCACARCDESFVSPGLLALHVGRRHPGSLDAGEREAFAAAEAEEARRLVIVARHFRAGFTVLPLVVFVVFLVSVMQQYADNPGWVIALVPGFLAFGVLLYGMSISRQQAKAEGRRGGPGT